MAKLNRYRKLISVFLACMMVFSNAAPLLAELAAPELTPEVVVTQQLPDVEAADAELQADETAELPADALAVVEESPAEVEEEPAVAEEAPAVIEEPVVEAPVVEAPVVEAPVVEAPVVEAPVVEAPVVEAPVVEEPVVEEPVVEEPVVEEPVVEEPMVEEPVVEEPVVEEPMVEEPMVEEPVVEEPVVEEPVVEEPVVEEPVVEEPVVEEPVVEEPVVEEPVVEEPVVEEPVVEEPVVEEPVVEEPVVEEPVVEEPMVEEPVVEVPVVEEPVVEVPVVEEPVIEESVVEEAPVVAEEPAQLAPALRSMVGMRLAPADFGVIMQAIVAGDIPDLYSVSILYLDGSGNNVAEPYYAVVLDGWNQTIPSPRVQGFTPGEASVSVVVAGANYEKTVTYTSVPVNYTVQHWQQQLDDSYALIETQTLQGMDGNTTQAKARSFLGFVEFPITQQTIAANGSTVVRVEYERLSYPLMFNTGIEGSASSSVLRKYQASLGSADLPTAPTRPGYTFAGWDWNGTDAGLGTMPATVPANALVAQASWTPATNTPYKVLYFVQNPDDDQYSPIAMLSGLTGTTGVIAPANYLAASGTFAHANATGPSGVGSPSYSLADLNTYFHQKSIEQEVIAGDGSTIVNVFYDRNVYTFRMYTDVYYRSANWSYYYATNNPPETHDYVNQQVRYQQSLAGVWFPSNSPSIAAITSHPGYRADRAVASYANGNLHTVGGGAPERNQFRFWTDYRGEWHQTPRARLDKDIINTTNNTATFKANWMESYTQPTFNRLYIVYYQNPTDNGYSIVIKDRVQGNELTAPWVDYPGVTKNLGHPDLHTSGAKVLVWETQFKNEPDNGNPLGYAFSFYYTRNNVTLVYDFNGSGQADKSETKRYGAPLDPNPVPTRTGYEFTGWTTDIAGEYPFTMDTMPPEDLRVYAGWQKLEYNVNLYLTAAETLPYHTTSLPYDTIPDQPETPTRDGYIFVRWNDRKTGAAYLPAPIAEDVNLEAIWRVGSQVEYTVNHYQKDTTTPVKPAETRLAFPEATVQESPASIYGFVPVSLDPVSLLVSVDGPNVVNLYYVPVTMVQYTTYYQDRGTKNTLSAPEPTLPNKNYSIYTANNEKVITDYNRFNLTEAIHFDGTEAAHLDGTPYQMVFFYDPILKYQSADVTTGTVSSFREAVLSTGTASTVTATPANGYTFEKWTNAKGDTVSTSASFAPVPANTSQALAHFTPETFTAHFIQSVSEPPVIHPVGDKDSIVTGTGVPGATVTVTFPGGGTATATVDENGNWTVPVSGPLTVGDVITATQTEKDKLPSEEATTTVIKSVIPTDPENPGTPTGYVLVKFDKGDHGSLTGTTAYNVKEGTAFSEITVPTITADAGWTANGWDKPLPSATDKVTAAATYTAQYTANTNTDYKVEHYLQNAAGNYGTPVLTELNAGTTGASVTATPGTYAGYTYDAAASTATGTIVGDGSLVLKLYYTANTNTAYKVEHYKLAADGTAPAAPTETENLTGTTGALVTATPKAYTGYTHDATVAGTVASGLILGDGSLVLKLYYVQNVKPTDPEDPQTPTDYVLVKFEKGDHGSLTGTTAYNVKIGTAFSEITVPTVTPEENWTFTAWNPSLPLAATKVTTNLTYTARYSQNVIPTDPEDPQTPPGYVLVKFLAGDHGTFSAPTAFNVNVLVDTPFSEVPVPEITPDAGWTFTGWNPSLPADADLVKNEMIFTAQYTANTNTIYKVEHYLQNADGSYPATAHETENLTGTTGAPATAADKIYVGYTYDAAASTATGTIAGDGSLVLKLYYTANTNTDYKVEHYLQNAGGNYGTPVLTELNAGTTGASVTATPGTYAGYTYDAAASTATGTIAGDGSLVLKLYYTANTNTAYKVEHYKLLADGTVPAAPTETENLTGTTGALVTATPKAYTGYTHDAAVAGTVASGLIAGDGSLVLKLYYVQNVIPTDPEDPQTPAGYVLVKFDKGANGELSTPTAFNVLIGTAFSEITVPTITPNPGWTANGWDKPLPAVADKVTTAATYTAQYLQNVIIVDPDDPTPDPGSDYVRVLFLKGTNGSLTGTTAYNVLIGTAFSEITVPTITPNPGWTANGWDKPLPAATDKVTAAATYTAQYKDDTVPDAPDIDPFEAGDTTVTGTGEPGATVTITWPDGSTTTDITVAENGTWTATVPEGVTLEHDDVVTATQTDPSGNESDPGSQTVKDTTPPDAPVIDEIQAGDTTVSGTGEPGATVTVTFPGGGTAEALVDENGNWTVTVPNDVILKVDDVVTATQTDPAGNTSEEGTQKVIDTTKPYIKPIPNVAVLEKAEITPIPVVATDNSGIDPTVTISGQPTGISYNPDTKVIEGIPTINDWGPTEEFRAFTITVTATDAHGNTAQVTFNMIVLRDTDGDGDPDIEDPDDDGDNIPDVDDNDPKVPDTTAPAIQPIADVTVIEKAEITPIPVVATDNSGIDPTVTISGQPTGISYNPDTKVIEGTPTIDDWGATEESRDFTITVTATDLSGNSVEVTFVMTVLRDTDGDGDPDVTDPDDDGDNIPDEDDNDPKVPDTTAPAIEPIDDVAVIEKAEITPIPVVATDNSGIDPTVTISGQPTGISYNPDTKVIEGTPTISDWGATEESRDFTITVTATDLSGNSVEVTFVMTVLRDTDGDGDPDVTDPDDDGDNIPDEDDDEPKVPDTTAPAIQPIDDVAVIEKAEITPIPVVATDNSGIDPTVTISGQPAGISYNPDTKVIEGTPTINDWGATEESRDFTITVTATDLSGNSVEVTFVMTVLRDTDGDGDPDVTDPDDDNDSIPDEDDNDPKVPDTTAPAIEPIDDVSVIEKAEITPIPVVATDNSGIDPTVQISGQPAGISYNLDTKQIEGIPTISDWGATEESRDFTITVTATDLSGNSVEVTFTMTVQRDTDGDGDPDVTDPDDDGDNIPDEDDNDPKVPDTTAPDAPVIDPIKEGDTTITGEGEPGATVTITYPDGTTQDVVVDDDGTWTATIPDGVDLVEGDVVTATQTDVSGNTSDEASQVVTDGTAPDAPVINPVKEGDKEVTGTGEPGATVTITWPDGSTTDTTVDENGDWTATVPEGVDLKEGDEITATQTDEAGNESQPTTVTVTDGTAPDAPVINPVKEGDKEVTGTGEPGATVTITWPDGSTTDTTVDENGKWTATVPVGVGLKDGDTITATQKDKAGNNSDQAKVTVTGKPVTPTKTTTAALAPPVIHSLFQGAGILSGTGAPGADISAQFADGSTLKTKVNLQGNWYLQVENAPNAGEMVTVHLNQDGQTSPPVMAIVQ